MSKIVKKMVMDEIQQKLDGNHDLLVVDSSRLDANTTNRWRLALRAKNIRALTVKNTLASSVLAENGVEGVDDLFDGPTTLVWGGEDVVALSKEIAKWANNVEKLVIKGGTVFDALRTPRFTSDVAIQDGRCETGASWSARALPQRAREEEW